MMLRSSTLLVVGLLACADRTPVALHVPTMVAERALLADVKLRTSFTISTATKTVFSRDEDLTDTSAPISLSFDGVPLGTYTFRVDLLGVRGTQSFPLLSYIRTAVSVSAGLNNAIMPQQSDTWTPPPEGASDDDGDGMSNVDELINGLDPLAKWTKIDLAVTDLIGFSGVDQRFLVAISPNTIYWLGDQQRTTTVADKSVTTRLPPQPITPTPAAACAGGTFASLDATANLPFSVSGPPQFYGLVGMSNACLVGIVGRDDSNGAAMSLRAPSAFQNQLQDTPGHLTTINPPWYSVSLHPGASSSQLQALLMDTNNSGRPTAAGQFFSTAAAPVNVAEAVPGGGWNIGGAVGPNGVGCSFFALMKNGVVATVNQIPTDLGTATSPAHCDTPVPAIVEPLKMAPMAQLGVQPTSGFVAPCGFFLAYGDAAHARHVTVLEPDVSSMACGMTPAGPVIKTDSTVALDPSFGTLTALHVSTLPMASLPSGARLGYLIGDDQGHVEILRNAELASPQTGSGTWESVAAPQPWGNAKVVGISVTQASNGSASLFVATASGIYRTP